MLVGNACRGSLAQARIAARSRSDGNIRHVQKSKGPREAFKKQRGGASRLDLDRPSLSWELG